MKQEVEGLRRLMVKDEPAGSGRQRILRGKLDGVDLLLAETGLGRAAVEKTVGSLTESYRVSALLSFGFGGALAEELEAGDLVLCARIYQGSETGATGSLDASPDLLDLAVAASEGIGLRIRIGRGVTTDRLLTTPEDKRGLGNRYGAQVVDMESYWVARAAAVGGIPFLALRAMSDTTGQSLPPFHRFFDREGRWQYRVAARHFLARPGDLATLPRLYLSTRLAARNLTGFLKVLIPRISGGSAATA